MESNLLLKFVGFTCMLVTLAFFTSFMEPINFTKFLILWFCTISIFAYFLAHHSKIKSSFNFKQQGSLIFLLFLNLASITYSYSQSRDPFISFYGYYAKYNGVITYVLWFILLILVSLVTNPKSSNIILKYYKITSLIVVSYGLMQEFLIDPFGWDVLDSGTFSTFGNPNFYGAFLATVGTLLFASILRSSDSRTLNSFFFCIVLISGFLTQTLQFYVLLILGITFCVLTAYSKLKLIRIGIPILSAVLIPAAILGLSGRGPLGRILFQESNLYRWQYWKNSISQFLERPLQGQGIELYGQYFRKFRDLEQVDFAGINHTSDSAHNVILHNFATGGMGFGITFLLLLVFIFLRGISNLRAKPSLTDQNIIFILWALLTIQNLFSVDNIALSTWGWVFAGLIMQREFPENPERTRTLNIVNKSSYLKIKEASIGIVLAVILLGGSVFAAKDVVLSQLEIKKLFYLAIDSDDSQAVKEKSERMLSVIARNPEDLFLYRLAANSLFIDRAYQATSIISQLGSQRFPDDYVVWWFYASSLEAEGNYIQARRARAQTIFLDPSNYSNYYLQAKNLKELRDLDGVKEMFEYLNRLSPNSPETKEVENWINR